MKSPPTRVWLRSFLNLGLRKQQDNIPGRDIERQEDTVLRALEMLDTQPGVVLADEVGMGKTYEALGVAAALHHRRPQATIVVVTPGPDLNRKWEKEFRGFKAMYNFGSTIKAVKGLAEFHEAIQEYPIIIAPITMFRGGRGRAAHSYMISLYAAWKGLHGKTTNAILRKYRKDKLTRVDPRVERFLGRYSYEEIEPHLRAAFVRGKNDELADSTTSTNNMETTDSTTTGPFHAPSIAHGLSSPGGYCQ